MSKLQRFLAIALVPLSAVLGRAATTDLAGNAIETAGLTPSGAWETYILQVAPTVTTANASDLASTSVTLGGEVTADGGVSVTDRGVVYSTTNSTPTVSDTKVAIGSGTGAFSQSVTGLTASTTYYVRAFATNSVGTAYGSAITVNTPPPAPVISSAATAGGTYGSSTFSYTIAASNSPTSFSSTTLPPGLSLNTSTGLISGTPTDTTGSPFSVTIRATNAGGTGTATLTITINKRAALVSVSTQFAAATKVYDGTTAVTNLTKPATVVFTGKFGTDDVSVDQTNAVGTFASKDVGNRSAAITGLVLTGTAAKHYSLSVLGSTPAVAITAKPLSVSGLAAASRVYDGSTTASITGAAALPSAISAGTGNATDGAPYSVDSVSVTGTASGAFADRRVGVGKAVTVSGLTLTGTGSTNYSLTQPTGLTADITPKPLTVTGVVSFDKEYDGSASAAMGVGSVALDGVVSGDSVSLNSALANANFSSETVGTNKTVTFSNFALVETGDWANYSLTQPTATASITPRAITVSGVTAKSKTYDRTTNAALDLSAAALAGVLGSDSVTFDSSSATGTFAAKDVGTGIVVTVSGLALSSSGDGANYTLTQPTGLTADIAAKGLTVTGISAADKTYDGNSTATLDTASATLVGVVSGDTVNLGVGGANGAFDNKNVGSSKTVTVAGLSIGSTGDAANYTLTQPTATATIAAKALTVTGVTASNKTYDGNSTAALNTAGAALVGVIGSESVTLNTGSATGAFANKNVGTGKTVTVSGLSIGSTGDAANYSLSQPTATANIAAKGLTVSGVTASDKTYDGNTVATLNTGSATLVGLVGGDSVTLSSGAATAAFDTKNVGANKTVTVAGLAIGTTGDAANYALTQPTTTAAITAKELTVSGVAATSKTYDGNTTASVNASGAALVGVIGGDSVSLAIGSISGAFDNKNAGTNKTVTIAGLSIGSTGDATNYTLTQPSTTADITAKALTVTGVTASDKTYDGLTSAVLITSSASLAGVVSGDHVTLATGSGMGSFDTKNVGTGKTVTVTGLSIGATGDAANYTLTQPTTSANITAKALTVSGVVASDKTYDGNTAATLNTAAAALVGVVNGDTVTLGAGSATGAFDSKNVGTNKTVTTAGFSIGTTGDASNYTLTQPTVVAGIAAKGLTVAGVTAGNKVYDGNAAAAVNASAATLVGVLAGESVTLSTGSASGTFDNKNVGTGKAVTVAGLSIGSTGDAANYTLTQPATTANITAKSLTVSGLTAADKTYDGNATASLNTAGAALVGVVGGDSVILGSASASGTFDNKNVGTNKTVTVTGLSIGTSGDAANYALTQPTATAAISAKGLAISGVTAANKTYDGNTTAMLNTSNAALVGVVGGDVVTLSANGVTGAFDTKNVGTNKPVTIAGFAIGTTGDATNYSLTQPGTTATITAKALTVAGVTASDKVYDGNTTATLNTVGAGLVGVVIGDSVSLAPGGATGTFDTKNVGTNKTVTVAGLAIGSTGDAANYSLSQPSTTASITAKELSVSGVVANNKTYDGNTTATVNAGSAALVGVVSGDSVILGAGSATGTFDTKNVGANKTVTVAGLSIGSTGDAANYSLTQPATTASITAKALTVSGVAASNKTYDGNTTASLITTGAAVVGVLSGETVTLGTSSATGAFDTKSVGTNKTVTVAGLSIGTTGDAANYSLTQPTTTANITTKPLAVTGVTAANRVYNANTVATLDTTSAALAGVVTGDVVTLDKSGATAAFADKQAGTTKAVTTTGFAIEGADASNYALTQPGATADIARKALTINGVSASDKVYDATLSVTLTGTPALGAPTAPGGSTADGNPYAGDLVGIAGTMSGAFADRQAGNGKIVTVSGLTLEGGDAGNYLITALTASANITPKPLAISGVAAIDRVYDATNIAPLSGTPVLAAAQVAGTGNATDGIPYIGDAVSLAGAATGTFANNTVASGKAVTVTGLTLSGDDAANYTPTLPAGLTAAITAKTLTIVGLTANARTYDGTIVAALSGTPAFQTAIDAGMGTTTDGKPFASDDVTLTGTVSGTFADRHVGTAKPITVSGLALGGAQAANYQLQHPTTLTADVTPKTLSSAGLAAVARIYDGTLVVPLAGTAALGSAEAPGAGSTGDGQPYTGDTVSITGTAGGVFADRHVGAAKPVTISGLALAGAQSANYALAMPAGVLGAVTPKALSVQGLAGAAKVYDATTSGPLTGTAALLAAQSPGAGTTADGHPYTGDTVALTGSAAASFGDKLVGTDKPLTITGLTLSGAQAMDYTLTPPAALTASITPKELTVTGVSVSPKTYNGDAVATLNFTTAALVGIAGTDTVTLVTSGATGTFASANAGGAVPVTIAGLALGGADASNYTLTQPGATGSIGKADASVALSNLAQTYTGSPRAATVTTTPGNLNVTVTYGGAATAPTNAGSYSVSATISESNHQGATSGTLTIAKATQTVTFAGPAGQPTVGTAFGLTASASSGLPISISIVSGNGTLSGSSLTLATTSPVTVRASQAGDANHEPATAERTFTATAAAKQPQTIAFDPISNKKTTDAAFGITAVATSGLPVSFSVLSGPALVSGSTVTLTGASGAVIVRASQGGNASFDAAPDVTQSFNVIGADEHQVFFGITQNNDTVAIDLAPDGTSGTLLCYIGASGEAFIVTFTVNPDGTFDATVTALSEVAGVSSAGDSAPGRAAAVPPRTFRGRLSGNTITGAIVELGLQFSTTLQPRSGPTANMSGLYQSSSINSAGGRTASIVGTEGQVLVVASTATISTGGTGAVNSDGAFTVQAAGATISGSVDAPTTTVSGTILVPNQPAVSFSGIASTTMRTDRLINLSSRARIGPAADRTLITGFVIGGADAKRVLLRAVGPTLAGFGVSGAIPNPRLQLYNGQGILVLENDDWSGADTAAAAAQVGAFTLASGARDAALLTTLAPGAYTMHVVDGGDTGVALAEIYDASSNPQGEYQRLVNISSRGTVEAGDGVLIGGFVVTGNSPKKVLVRGVGPALSGFGITGALADPRLAIYSGATVIASNNDWSVPTPISSTQVAATAGELAEAARATGAFAYRANSRDAAVVITLAPGAYTAQVSAVDGSTGVALVEIYEIPE